MTLNDYNEFCASLPHTFHVIQWGGAHVWKLGSREKFRVFALAGWEDDTDQLFVTFKVSATDYEVLKKITGCRPAPYLASRGMKWIQWMNNTSVSDNDLRNFIEASYVLASKNLTKKLQKQLKLNEFKSI